MVIIIICGGIEAFGKTKEIYLFVVKQCRFELRTVFKKEVANLSLLLSHSHSFFTVLELAGEECVNLRFSKLYT